MHKRTHRILHTPMIYPSDYTHVHVYIHVNTCMYARLDVIIIQVAVRIDIGTHASNECFFWPIG